MSESRSEDRREDRPESEPVLEAAELSLLVDLSRRLSGVLEYERLFEVLSSFLQQTLSIDSLAIHQRCDEETRLASTPEGIDSHLPSEFTCDPALWKRLSQGSVFQVVCDGEAVRIRDDSEASVADGQTAVLAVPLLREDEPIGLLVVARSEPTQIFSDRDRVMLKEIGAQVAGCLFNCRQFEARQSEKQQLDQSVQNLSLLYNVGRALNDISDLRSLLKFILEQAMEIAQAEKGSIMTHNMDTGLLSVRVMQGLKDETLQERINNSEAICRSFRPGEGIAGKVFESGEAIVANNLEDDPNFVAGESSFARSIICIPMVVYDEVLGVINLTNKRGAPGFTSEDMDLLRAVADQAAVAYNKHQLWDMSITDSLTGLYDRRYFKIRLMDESQRAERYNKFLSIAMADLDNFKGINDTYGHAVGDQFLIAIGQYLQINVRNVDLVARYGGEEFIMFFPETDNVTARTLSERIRLGVSRIRIPSYPGITISFGIATYPNDSEDMSDLIRKADMAMYAAKQLGRNRVVAYNTDVDQLWGSK